MRMSGKEQNIWWWHTGIRMEADFESENLDGHILDRVKGFRYLRSTVDSNRNEDLKIAR